MTEPKPKTPFLSDKVYNVAKKIAQIYLPAAGALYFALAGIWGFPRAEDVIGTITSVDAFLGVLLGVSTLSYNKSDARYAGDLEITDQPDGPKLYSLSLTGDPEDMDAKKEVSFKVVQKQP